MSGENAVSSNTSAPNSTIKLIESSKGQGNVNANGARKANTEEMKVNKAVVRILADGEDKDKGMSFLADKLKDKNLTNINTELQKLGITAAQRRELPLPELKKLAIEKKIEQQKVKIQKCIGEVEAATSDNNVSLRRGAVDQLCQQLADYGISRNDEGALKGLLDEISSTPEEDLRVIQDAYKFKDQEVVRNSPSYINVKGSVDSYLAAEEQLRNPPEGANPVNLRKARDDAERNLAVAARNGNLDAEGVHDIMHQGGASEDVLDRLPDTQRLQEKIIEVGSADKMAKAVDSKGFANILGELNLLGTYDDNGDRSNLAKFLNKHNLTAEEFKAHYEKHIPDDFELHLNHGAIHELLSEKDGPLEAAIINDLNSSERNQRIFAEVEHLQELLADPQASKQAIAASQDKIARLMNKSSIFSGEKKVSTERLETMLEKRGMDSLPKDVIKSIAERQEERKVESKEKLDKRISFAFSAIGVCIGVAGIGIGILIGTALIAGGIAALGSPAAPVGIALIGAGIVAMGLGGAFGVMVIVGSREGKAEEKAEKYKSEYQAQQQGVGSAPKTNARENPDEIEIDDDEDLGAGNINTAQNNNINPNDNRDSNIGFNKIDGAQKNRRNSTDEFERNSFRESTETSWEDYSNEEEIILSENRKAESSETSTDYSDDSIDEDKLEDQLAKINNMILKLESDNDPNNDEHIKNLKVARKEIEEEIEDRDREWDE